MSTIQTILLVDDNDELRTASAALLRGAGYRVVEAADADEARGRFGRHDGAIDLVITDVNMPGTDGIQLAEELRQAVPRLPILFISSHVDARLGKRLAQDDVAFLAKPFGPASLRKALERAQAVAARAVAAAPLGGRRGFRPPARRGPMTWLAAAAVAILAIGVAAELRRHRAPELPATVPSSVLRSTTVEPLYPIGSATVRPATLGWRPVPEADAYRVELRRIGYDLVFEATVERSTVALPDAVRAQIDPGVEYTWRVEALRGGGRIAISEEARFRLDPRADAVRVPGFSTPTDEHGR